MQYVLGMIVAVGIAFLAILHVNSEGQSASKTSSVSDAISEVQTFAYNIQNDFDATGQSFSGLTNQVAIADHDVPPAYVASGTNISNGWGGPVTVEADASNPADFDIDEGNVPGSECSRYAQGMPNAVSVSVNGTSMTAPLNTSDVSAACADSTSTVTFVMNPGS